MAFTDSQKKEIETIVRKEIKDFLKSNTVNQFEKKLIDNIRSEMKKGNLRTDINEYIATAFSEFYYTLWRNRGTWESNLKRIS